MLARFTTNMGVFRVWDVRLEACVNTVSIYEGDDSIVLDLAALRRLFLPLPYDAWQRAASMYGRAITPIYRNFQNMISYDLERVTQVLSDIEPLHVIDEFDEPVVDSYDMICPMNLQGSFIEPEPWIPAVPARSRPRRTDLVVLESLCSPIPTIIITPPQGEHEGYCRIPLQNSAFHNQLTVPKHPTFNHIHPPMALTSHMLPVLSHWRWRDGHWQGIVPSVEEQSKRGLFSKPFVARRRSSRTCLKS